MTQRVSGSSHEGSSVTGLSNHLSYHYITSLIIKMSNFWYTATPLAFHETCPCLTVLPSLHQLGGVTGIEAGNEADVRPPEDRHGHQRKCKAILGILVMKFLHSAIFTLRPCVSRPLRVAQCQSAGLHCGISTTLRDQCGQKCSLDEGRINFDSEVDLPSFSRGTCPDKLSTAAEHRRPRPKTN